MVCVVKCLEAIQVVAGLRSSKPSGECALLLFVLLSVWNFVVKIKTGILSSRLKLRSVFLRSLASTVLQQVVLPLWICE